MTGTVPAPAGSAPGAGAAPAAAGSADTYGNVGLGDSGAMGNFDAPAENTYGGYGLGDPDAMAYGGATRDPRFIVGDRHDGRPTGTEEMIINPTRAPIQVVPNSRLAAYYGGTMPDRFADGTDSRLGMYPRYDEGTETDTTILAYLFDQLRAKYEQDGDRESYKRGAAEVQSRFTNKAVSEFQRNVATQEPGYDFPNPGSTTDTAEEIGGLTGIAALILAAKNPRLRASLLKQAPKINRFLKSRSSRLGSYGQSVGTGLMDTAGAYRQGAVEGIRSAGDEAVRGIQRVPGGFWNSAGDLKQNAAAYLADIQSGLPRNITNPETIARRVQDYIDIPGVAQAQQAEQFFKDRIRGSGMYKPEGGFGPDRSIFEYPTDKFRTAASSALEGIKKVPEGVRGLAAYLGLPGYAEGTGSRLGMYPRYDDGTGPIRNYDYLADDDPFLRNTPGNIQRRAENSAAYRENVAYGELRDAELAAIARGYAPTPDAPEVNLDRLGNFDDPRALGESSIFIPARSGNPRLPWSTRLRYPDNQYGQEVDRAMSLRDYLRDNPEGSRQPYGTSPESGDIVDPYDQPVLQMHPSQARALKNVMDSLPPGQADRIMLEPWGKYRNPQPILGYVRTDPNDPSVPRMSMEPNPHAYRYTGGGGFSLGEGFSPGSGVIPQTALHELTHAMDPRIFTDKEYSKNLLSNDYGKASYDADRYMPFSPPDSGRLYSLLNPAEFAAQAGSNWLSQKYGVDLGYGADDYYPGTVTGRDQGPETRAYLESLFKTKESYPRNAYGTDSRLGEYPRYADGVLPVVQGAPAGSLAPITQDEIVNMARQYSPQVVNAVLGQGEAIPRQLPVQSASMRQTNNLTSEDMSALGTRLAAEGTSITDYNALQQGLFGNKRTSRRGRLVI
jgi:hypothetical protein